MKRKCNVFDDICDVANITTAHDHASRGKTKYEEVKRFNLDPHRNCTLLSEMLRSGEFRTSPYEVFTITDRGKTREISKLPYFPDRVVQWAIMLQIEEVFTKHFIFDTYAAIPKKGTHVASNRLSRWLRNDPEGTRYCYKFDIQKFFPNIDHDILKSLLRKKFKDERLLTLLDEIVDSTDSGIPIGNYISQYFANYYLSFFDHWVKEVLGVKYYMRYMDDIILLRKDKQHLHDLRASIELYLHHELKLQIKRDWQVFAVDKRHIDFMGYQHKREFKRVRKSTAYRFKRAVRGIVNLDTKARSVIASYAGHLKHCSAYNLFKKHTMRLPL